MTRPRRADPPSTVAAPALSLDALDRRIVAILQRDGRLSNSAIARALGVAEATIRRRIERLVDSGALRIVAVPSPELAGLTLSAIIGISCDLKRLEDVGRTIAGFTETRYLGYSTGSF